MLESSIVSNLILWGILLYQAFVVYVVLMSHGKKNDDYDVVKTNVKNHQEFLPSEACDVIIIHKWPEWLSNFLDKHRWIWKEDLNILCISVARCLLKGVNISDTPNLPTMVENQVKKVSKPFTSKKLKW